MLSAGTTLVPCRFLAPPGAGGRGEAYRAHDSRPERDVAIKVRPRRLVATPERRPRFEREARTISPPDHPHIRTLYDVGREGDVDDLVMESIEDEPLAHLVPSRAAPGGA